MQFKFSEKLLKDKIEINKNYKKQMKEFQKELEKNLKPLMISLMLLTISHILAMKNYLKILPNILML